MFYIKILETFIFSVLLDKNDYNIFHKNFKPIKIMVILILFGNVFFSMYLMNTLFKVHQRIEEICPNIYDEATEKKLQKALGDDEEEANKKE